MTHAMIGGGAPPIGIKVKDPTWVISKAMVVSFQHMVVSIKNEDSNLNHLPQMQAFASMRSTPFMEINDKEGEIVQRYESFRRN